MIKYFLVIGQVPLNNWVIWTLHWHCTIWSNWYRFYISDRSFVSFCSSTLWHFCESPVWIRPPWRRPHTLRPGWNPLQHRGHSADHQQGWPQLVAGSESRCGRNSWSHSQSRASGKTKENYFKKFQTIFSQWGREGRRFLRTFRNRMFDLILLLNRKFYETSTHF